MSEYELTLRLRGAMIRIGFDDTRELGEKLQNLDLGEVANLIDEAMDRLPHPPDRESTFLPPSSPQFE